MTATDIVEALLGDSGSITLRELFAENEPEQNVLDEIGKMYWDNPIPIRTLSPEDLGDLRTTSPGHAVRDSISDAKRSSTWNIVQRYKKDFLTNGYQRVAPILIAREAGYIMDGHHRALGAFLAKSPIRFVDVCDAENQ